MGQGYHVITVHQHPQEMNIQSNAWNDTSPEYFLGGLKCYELNKMNGKASRWCPVERDEEVSA